MNKSDLVNRVADEVKYSPFVMPRVNAKSFMEASLKTIKAALKSEEEVIIRGFGTFKIITHKAKTWRNPTNGKRQEIPRMKHVKFIPSKSLRSVIAEIEL